MAGMRSCSATSRSGTKWDRREDVMLIALLDDGIDLRRCPDIRLREDLSVQPDGTIRPRRAEEIIRTSHGTTCAQIIHKYAPEAEFCSQAIFLQPKLRTSPAQLLAALDWCLEKKISLVHMSAGTTQLCDQEPIRRQIAKMIQQGQTIVAARSNDAGRYTVPACCAGVLGVAADPELTGDQFYVLDAIPDDVQIFASSRHDLSAYPWGKAETVVSNSYAAPTVTAKIHEVLSNGWKSIPELYRALAKGTVSMARMRPDFLSSALVFDPEHSIKTPELIDFQVLGMFDNEADFLAATERNQRASAVLAPPLPSNRIWQELFSQSENRCGIVYAGEAAGESRAAAPCLFWDETARRSLTSLVTRFPLDPEIPFVQVESCGESSLRLLCGLRDRLVREGYGCVAITDQPMAYLYGLECLSRDCQPEVLAAHLCRTHRPDIVLCSLGTPDAALPCDQRIFFGPCRDSKGSGDVMALPEGFGEADIEAVFQALLE